MGALETSVRRIAVALLRMFIGRSILTSSKTSELRMKDASDVEADGKYGGGLRSLRSRLIFATLALSRFELRPQATEARLQSLSAASRICPDSSTRTGYVLIP